jgi:subtilisin family serine protease
MFAFYCIRRCSFLLLGFVQFLLILIPVQGHALAQTASSGSDWWYADGVLIVNFKPETSRAAFTSERGVAHTGLAQVDALFTKYRVNSLEKLFVGAAPARSASEADLSGYYRITFDPKEPLEKAFDDFRALPEIEHVEKTSIHPVYATPNDPSFSSQWGLNQSNDQDVDAPEAWNTETGDSAILIGAMDTGVNWQHPDLAGPSPYVNGNIWINWAEYNGTPGVDDDGDGYVDDIRGWDWVTGVSAWPGEDGATPDNDPMDFNGHGTHTAGIMAAITNNGVGVAGVAGGWSPSQRGCRIVPLRIGWSQSNGGQEMGYVRMDFAAQAFYYAAARGVKSVNCSWGSSNDGAIGAAVTFAIQSGMVVVSAAGNDNNTTASYLCSRSDVLAVASLTSSGTRSSFSSYGTWVDVAAPGSNIYSTYSNHNSPGYASLSGTSMAAPFVTGMAGLLRSLLPSITKNALDTLIISTTDNIDAQNPSYVGMLGTGRINLATALSQIFAAQVSADQRFGKAPFTVNFTGTAPGTVTSWKWYFGDGDSAAVQNPAHTYVAPGRYDVRLRVSGSQGTNTTVMPAYIFAHADTLKMQAFSARKTDPLIYEIRLRNYAPITSLTLPISYRGNMDISLDSISYIGTRGLAFESRQMLASSSANYGFALQLIANNGGGAPPLAAGEGVLCRLYFKYDAAPTLPGHNVVDTTVFNGFFFVANTSFGYYAPAIAAGSIDISGVRGDVDQSGNIDISDPVFLIAYIFSGGVAPPLYSGDADASGAIDVSDVVYLITYIFGGGPPPPAR